MDLIEKLKCSCSCICIYLIATMSAVVQTTTQNDSQEDHRELMSQKIHDVLRKEQDGDRYPLEDIENAMIHGGASRYGYICQKKKIITMSDSNFPPEKLESVNCSRGSRYFGASERYKHCTSESSGYNVGHNHSMIKQADHITTYSNYNGRLYRNEMKLTEVIRKNTWYKDICEIEKSSLEYADVIKHLKMLIPTFNPNKDNGVVTILKDLEYPGTSSLVKKRAKLFQIAYTPNKLERKFEFYIWDQTKQTIINGSETSDYSFSIKDTPLQNKNAFYKKSTYYVCYYDEFAELHIDPYDESKEYPDENVKLNFTARAYNEKTLKEIEKYNINISEGGMYFVRCGSIVSVPSLFGTHPGSDRFRSLYLEIAVEESVHFFDKITKCKGNKKIQPDAYNDWDDILKKTLTDHMVNSYKDMKKQEKENGENKIKEYKEKFNLFQNRKKKITISDVNPNQPLKQKFESIQEIDCEIQKTENDKNKCKSTEESQGLWKKESNTLPSIMNLYIQFLELEKDKIESDQLVEDSNGELCEDEDSQLVEDDNDFEEDNNDFMDASDGSEIHNDIEVSKTPTLTLLGSEVQNHDDELEDAQIIEVTLECKHDISNKLCNIDLWGERVNKILESDRDPRTLETLLTAYAHFEAHLKSLEEKDSTITLDGELGQVTISNADLFK